MQKIPYNTATKQFDICKHNFGEQYTNPNNGNLADFLSGVLHEATLYNEYILAFTKQCGDDAYIHGDMISLDDGYGENAGLINGCYWSIKNAIANNTIDTLQHVFIFVYIPKQSIAYLAIYAPDEAKSFGDSDATVISNGLKH